MMRRAEIINTIQGMPDEFSAEKLFERILVLQQIDDGLAQVVQNLSL
jgi:hypothetical protein